MGNILEVYTPGDDRYEDFQFLGIQNESLFNSKYLAAIVHKLPNYPGTEICLGPEEKSGVAEDEALIRLQEIISDSKNELIATTVDGYKNLALVAEIFQNSESARTDTMRTRLLYRIHHAVQREIQRTKAQLWDKCNITLPIDQYANNISSQESSQQSDPLAMITATSIRMSLSILKSVESTNTDLFRSCSESLMDIYKHVSISDQRTLSASMCDRNSLQYKTMQSVVEYAYGAACTTRGQDR